MVFVAGLTETVQFLELPTNKFETRTKFDAQICKRLRAGVESLKTQTPRSRPSSIYKEQTPTLYTRPKRK